MISSQLSAAARDAGLHKVISLTEFDQAYRAIRAAAHVKAEITTDEVWAVLEAADVTSFLHPNALGAAVRRAAWLGLIASTGRFRKSSRVSAHRRNVQVWKSLIYAAVAA